MIEAFSPTDKMSVLMTLITYVRKTQRLILFRRGRFFKRVITKIYVSSTTAEATEVIFFIEKYTIVIEHFQLQLHHVLGHN